MEDISSHRLSIDEVVESGQFLQFQRSHPEKPSGLFEGLIAQVTIMSLHGEHDVQRQLARVLRLQNLFLERIPTDP